MRKIEKKNTYAHQEREKEREIYRRFKEIDKQKVKRGEGRDKERDTQGDKKYLTAYH